MQAPPKIFDAARIRRNLMRRPAGHDDFVTRLALDDLDDRLSAVSRQFEKALIMAPDATPLPDAGVSAAGPR